MIGGLVLAAGQGSRFGGAKQVALVEGRPLVARVAAMVADTPSVARVVVVAGAYVDEVREAIGSDGAEVVVAGDWQEGLAASLRTGVDELSDCDAIVVMLADQPFVTTEVVRAVIDGLGDSAAARATYDGVPGHPVVITRSVYEEIRRLRGDTGARELLEDVGVLTVECGHMANPLDVDTPEDLAAARELLTKERA